MHATVPVWRAACTSMHGRGQLAKGSLVREVMHSSEGELNVLSGVIPHRITFLVAYRG